MFQVKDEYYYSQLEAIQNFYKMLCETDKPEVSLSDAIITWFTDGYAEQFREEYLRDHPYVNQN